MRPIRPISKPAPPKTCANIIICRIQLTNYLLDQQLKALEAGFLEEGGFTERLHHSRRKKQGRLNLFSNLMR
jgi:four helix bundle suffix protein